MGKALHLLGDGRQNLRVAMPGIEYRDAAGEIDIAPALDIPDFSIAGAGGRDRRDMADAADDGILAAGQQFGIGRHGVSSLSGPKPPRASGPLSPGQTGSLT